MSMARPKQFDSLTASSLYCQSCQTATPVRERLLLVLPGREIHGYFCSRCGNAVGEREVAQTNPHTDNNPPGGLILP